MQHADALTIGVDNRLVGRYVPVVDNERVVDPGVALVEHAASHRVRHARADGALAAIVGNVGADAHVVEKHRDRSEAALGQAARPVDQIADGIHQPEAVIQHDAAVEQRHQGALGIAHRRDGANHQGAVLGAALAGRGMRCLEDRHAGLADQLRALVLEL